MRFPILTPEEAADLFYNDCNCGFSGFTAPGAPKMVTQAIAAKAERLHEQGEPFKINIVTGASTSDLCDGMLARANAIGRRTPIKIIPTYANASIRTTPITLTFISQRPPRSYVTAR